jgi:ankyrin repeat protein
MSVDQLYIQLLEDSKQPDGQQRVAARIFLNKSIINDKMNYSDKRTMLHEAAIDEKNYMIAAELINSGANVNALDSTTWTPLHYAANNKNINLCRLLLEKGAFVSHRNSDGNTPLHFAAKKKDERIIELLIKKGANAAIINNVGNTSYGACDSEKIRDYMNQLLRERDDQQQTAAHNKQPATEPTIDKPISGTRTPTVSPTQPKPEQANKITLDFSYKEIAVLWPNISAKMQMKILRSLSPDDHANFRKVLGDKF